MNFTITARHFKMKEDLKDYVEAKVKKLDRFYDNILDMDVILGWEKLNRYTEIRINVNNKQIVIKEMSDEIRKSFDTALERAERQLKRYKDKRRKPTKVKAVSV
ncbi:MAG: ribosome-associated translation inhibitor RaiA [Calditrichaeota bacterium]|nr:ribosome-associated translation inhibitor RaiA [Calditrichota bacterium]